MKTGVLDLSSISCSGVTHTPQDQFGKNSSDTQFMYCKRCGSDQVYTNSATSKTICPHCGPCIDYVIGGRNYSEQLFSNIMWTEGIKVECDQ